jgi:hypothetical protein
MAVGHVIPIANRHEIVNPIFADFIAGAGETYSRNDYDMLLSVVPDEDERRPIAHCVERAMSTASSCMARPERPAHRRCCARSACPSSSTAGRPAPPRPTPGST